MQSLRLLPILFCLLLPLRAQDDTPPGEPPAQPENGGGNEYHSVERPVRLYGHIRLDGIWEIHIGGRNTGVELEIRQISDRYHATFSKPPANNPLGIKVGDDFLWATIKDHGGTGTLFVVSKPDKPGDPVKREQAPARFRINNTAEKMQVQVNKEDMDEAMRNFELVRVGRIESLRLYTVGPDGLQATGTILENQPMVIEIKHSNPRPSPIDVTITSGSNSITLTARALEEDKKEGPRLGLMRTDPFYPTFGMQLGVTKPPREEKEPKGREATEEDMKRFTGSWRTLYQDGALGPVTGWMHIDEYGRPNLRYRQPGEGLRDLKLKSARVDGETEAAEAEDDTPAIPSYPKLILHFEGQGVISDKIEKETPDEEHRLLLDPQSAVPVSIKANDYEVEADLTYMDVPDFREVTLTLQDAMPNGSLVWSWEYLGDRATARDREGLGRAGTLIRAEGENESTLGRVVGREVWMKMPPTILAAYATDNQTGADREFMGNPVYKNRYSSRPTWDKDDEPTIFGPTGESTRRVFIVARNLPPATEKLPFPDLIIGEGSGVSEYRIRARGTQHDPNNSDELKEAWRQYSENRRRASAGQPATERVVAVSSGGAQAPDTTATALQEGVVEEGLFILAITKPGAEPGPQPFTLAEAKGDWNLMFGDLRGTLMLARELVASQAADGDLEADSGEYEALSPAFAPEKIRLVVQMESAADSVKEIKAVLGHNDEIISSSNVEDAAPAPFVLKPDPNDPKTYLSPKIHLIRKGTEGRPALEDGEIWLLVGSGDKLSVRVQTDSGYYIQPARLTVDVMATPSELNQHWEDAVKKAAELAGKPVDDWEAVVRGTAASQTNFIFTEWAWNAAIDTAGLGLYGHLLDIANYAKRNGVTVPYHSWLPQREPSGGIRSIKISIGDHAAMLLLRREFLTMMEEQIADWNRNLSPDNIRALYNSQKDLIASKRSPLSFMRIPMRSLPVYREEPRSGVISETRVYLAENKLWWVAVENSSPILAEAIKFFAGDNVGQEDDPYLYELFDNEFLGYKTRVPAQAEYFELFQWSAFNHAYREWGPQMGRSLAQARAIPDGDVKALLKLTGMGFVPVVKRVVPRMMKLQIDNETSPSEWQPDFLARAHVKSLGVLGSAVRAQEDYSAVDTTVLMAAAAVATAPLGGGGFWSSLIVAGVSAADVAYTIYNDVYGNSLRKEELEFEVGAGAVLGAERAADVESKVLGDLAQTFAVVGSGIGLAVDGADLRRAYKAHKIARNLDTAELLDRGQKLLKDVDFADPQALRRAFKAFSEEDAEILAELVRRSEELAARGRLPAKIGELTENPDAILDYFKGARQFEDEAIDLQRKMDDTNRQARTARDQADEVLAQPDKTPPRQLREPDLDAADKKLADRISDNKTKIKELDGEAQVIKDRYPDQDYPPTRTEDFRRFQELKNESAKLRFQNNDLNQRRGVISSYRKAEVEVPPRQADLLTGRALPDSPDELDALARTRKSVEDDIPPVSTEGYRKLDLESTRKDLKDLEDARVKEIGELEASNPRPNTPEARRLDEARAELDNYRARGEDIDEMARSIRNRSNRPTVELSDRDAKLLFAGGDDAADASKAGRIPLTPADEAQVFKAIRDAEGDWGELSGLAKGSPEDQLLLHKVNQWRREKMDDFLNKSMREVENDLGLEPGTLRGEAFGSSNLTSDYDISVTGPGIGKERAIRRFQEKVRNYFGGRESGLVMDVNTYTDPFYVEMKGANLEKLTNLTTKQIDTSRQFTATLMANAKYRSPAQWKALRERVLEGVPESARKSISDLMDQAEGANAIGKGRIEQRLRKAGIDPSEATDADLLRVNNDLYSDTVESLDRYKVMIDGLQKAKAGEIPPTKVALGGFLDDPALSGSLAKAEELMKSGDPKLVAQGESILKDLEIRAISNARNQQAEALYYAAEAYQAEATINHVVKEIQAPPPKLITADSIMTGNHNLKPPKKPLAPEDYTNSFFENGANLVKELNAKGILDDVGNPATFEDLFEKASKSEKFKGASETEISKYVNGKIDKGATKASKYFVRQLDAASMAKLDMKSVQVPGFPEGYTFENLVEHTLKLEANRGDMGKFKRALEDLGMSSEDYLTRVTKAQEELDRRLMSQSGLPDFADKIRTVEKQVETDASRFFRKRAAAIGPAGEPLPRLARGMGLQHLAGGSEAEKIRNDFDATVGSRLQELDDAANVGRLLTPDQETERENLRKAADAQNILDQAITGARLSGVPPTDIGPILNGVSRDNENWRQEASERILREAGKRQTSPHLEPGTPATLPDAARNALGIEPVGENPTANDLIGAYKSKGNYAETRPDMSLEEIATNQESGRTVLTNVRKPDGTSSWVRIHAVTDGSIIADDPVSGSAISYPPGIFKSLAGESLIADPFRDANGSIQ